MNINIFKIIADADIVVQLILLLLVFFSVFSWAIIFFKHKTLKSASRQSDRFLEAFRRSKSLTEVNEVGQEAPGEPARRHLPRRQQGAGLPVEVDRRERLDRREDREPQPARSSRPPIPRSPAWRR